MRDGGSKVIVSWEVEAGIACWGARRGWVGIWGDQLSSVEKQRGQAQAEGKLQGERRWHREVKGERPDYGGLHRAGK